MMRRRLASRHLVGGALDWWYTIVSIVDEQTVTWEDFRSRFSTRFLPEADRVALVRQFYELRQLSSLVNDYVWKFLELSRNAQELVS